MLSTPNPMNILDYCNDFLSGKIKVDKNYQRTDKVWPEQAKRYLIESILLGYPIPKFFLQQKIDARSRTALKFVVDGQQRSKAIVEFFQNKLSISKKCKYYDIAGKSFDTLPEEYQNRFLSYSLPIDLFITAQQTEIIETFRRINSYTVPLNSEERRHAYHQGNMKWFIHDLATKHSDTLQYLGVFSEKNLARMADYKFYAEIVCFLDMNGIITTTSRILDNLYTKYDKNFPNSDDFQGKIEKGFAVILDWDWLTGLNVTKTHIFQMLLTALIFNGDKQLRSMQLIKEQVSELSEALEEGKSEEFKEFLTAASKTTNAKDRRQTIYNAFVGMLFQ